VISGLIGVPLCQENGFRPRFLCEYDGANRMIRGGDAVYRYDANGNRIAKEDAEKVGYQIFILDILYHYPVTPPTTGLREHRIFLSPVVPVTPRVPFDKVVLASTSGVFSRQTDTTTTTYEYDAANRMIRGGDAIYRYDANGNRVAKEDAGLYRYHTEHPDVSYQYDYEDRLIRIVEQQLHPSNRTAHGEDLPAGLSRKPALQFVTEYRYDASGRRVEKHTGPSFNGMLEGTVDDVRFEQVRYLYDGLEVLHEHSSRQDHQTKAFYRAGGRLVAQFRYATSDGFNSGQFPRMYLDYYSHNGLGSVATLTHYEDDECKVGGHPLKGLLSRKRLRHPRKNRFFLPEQSCQVLYALIVSTFPHPLFRRFCVSYHYCCTQSPIRFKAAVELRRA
jgi:hypothetical protein